MTVAGNADVKVNITTWFDGKGLTAAERELRRAYKMQETAANEMAAAEKRAAAARKEALNSAANTMLGVGVAMTAFAGLAVAKFAQFDQAMSNVAASGQDAKDNLNALKDAALEAGARTSYSATEAAGAIEELAKAGMSAQDILAGGLNGALDLAAAGQLEVADAAQLTATTLTQFGLAGNKAAHVADLLSAGANKAQGNVSDMGLALSYVGTSAAQLGVSVEETAGVLALLASNGILAEKAGTGLRGVIMALTAPSKAASAAMAEYGINVFDAAGNFVGLEGVAGQLHDQLGGLDEATRTAALGQIFGNEQINAARVLYAGGADAVRTWTAAVDDSGNAARAASERTDNLMGDIERLGGSWETLLIKMGEGADGPLRDMVQTVTGAIDAFDKIPPAAQTALLAIVGGGGLALLGAGGMIKLTTAINDARVAMQALGWSVKGVTAVAAGVGAIIAVATLAFSHFAQAQAEARQKSDEYKQTLDAETSAITANTRTLAANNLEKSGALEAANRLGVDSKLLVDAILGESGAMEELNSRLATYQGTAEMGAAARQQMLEDRNMLEEAVGRENKSLEESIAANKRQAEAVGDSASAQGDATGAARDATGAYQDQKSAVDDLIDALDTLNGANQSREQAEIDWQKRLEDTSAAIRDNGRTLEITTEAGRNNRQAMLDMAEAAGDLADARLKQTGSEDLFRQTIDDGRKALFDQARQFFDSDEAAWAYVDTLLKVPPYVTTTVSTPGLAAAAESLEAFYTKAIQLDGKVITVRTNYTYTGTATGSAYIPKAYAPAQADGSVLRFYASGGFEDHVAQIAPAGSWRVWAEPETGGESYIPLAPSKRARSVEVWQQTGDALGVGRGVTVNVTADPRFAERQARLIVRSMRDAQASQGAAWGVI